MKPERIQNHLTAEGEPTWATEKAKVSKTYLFPSPPEAHAFATFVQHIAVRGGASELACGVWSQQLAVEVSSAHETGLTDADYQLTQTIDKAYGLFMGDSTS